MTSQCPGQGKRSVKAELMCCPSCGYEVEIFSDEVRVRCPSCKAAVIRQKLPSCADWCQAARECIGEERWKQLKGG